MKSHIYTILSIAFFVGLVVLCTYLFGGYGMFVWGAVLIIIINGDYKNEEQTDPNE